MRAIWGKLRELAATAIKVSTTPASRSILYTVANTLLLTVTVITVLLLFITLSFYMQISFLKNIAIWTGVGLSFYWVISAMWCLYDKDDYGRGVSASDDFYNVAFTSFWLIEGFLLSLFLAYARMFDFYDPFLESDELEHSLVNEDIDSGNLKFLLTCFISALIISCSVDIHNTQESINFVWFFTFVAAFFFVTLLSFLKLSVRFIEEFDFEEDSDYIFDESDNIFEHEDFPEEGFDGGDYAEGYEILQLFFGYWHYTFIVLHLTYLVYALVISGGRQQHIYWATTAISQNIVLIVVLDFLDWGEVFSTFDLVTFDSVYTWFYSSEDAVSDLQSIWSDMFQLVEKTINFLDITSSANPKLLPTDEEFKKQVLESILKEV